MERSNGINRANDGNSKRLTQNKNRDTTTKMLHNHRWTRPAGSNRASSLLLFSNGFSRSAHARNGSAARIHSHKVEYCFIFGLFFFRFRFALKIFSRWCRTHAITRPCHTVVTELLPLTNRAQSNEPTSKTNTQATIIWLPRTCSWRTNHAIRVYYVVCVHTCAMLDSLVMRVSQSAVAAAAMVDRIEWVSTIRYGHWCALRCDCDGWWQWYIRREAFSNWSGHICVPRARCSRDSWNEVTNSVDNVLILFFGHFFSSTNFVICVGEVTLWGTAAESQRHTISAHQYIHAADLPIHWRWEQDLIVFDTGFRTSKAVVDDDGSRQIWFCRCGNRSNGIDKTWIGFEVRFIWNCTEKRFGQLVFLN